jgi:nitrogen fixation/metabolism regulation signal transduction histidine kinase
MMAQQRTVCEQSSRVLPAVTAHAVVAADAGGVIVFWDAGAQHMYGLAAGQVVGERNVGDLFGPPLDGVTGLRDLLGQLLALAPAPAVWAGEVECRHASGNWFTADVVITPFRPRNGAPPGVALVCRPVPAQVPSTHPTQAALTSAGPGPPAPSADAFGAQVLSKLGHELRSPLAAIIGLTRILLMRLAAGQADAATQVRQLEMIQASAARSLATIEQVVDLARIESGRVCASPQLVDCRDLVAEVAAELRVAAGERGLCLCADVPQYPVVITTDPGILRWLLRELTGNALRFTDAGEVRIRLHASDGPVVIDVSDDGPGIPLDEQARIFEPFERGARPAEGDDGAPGLGLGLARKQADLLGAQLSVRSQAGSGSTFSVTFADPHSQPGKDPGS